MIDFDILIMLVLVSTHLAAFGIGWAMRHVELRRSRRLA